MAPEWKYALITFGIGCLIVIMEWNMARKKKDGVDWADRKRFRGLLGVAAGISVLVYFIVLLSD